MTAADEFEGREVVSTQLIVTGTGDGLSKALQVKPTMIHHGDHVYLLIKAAGHKVRFDPHKDDPEQLVRVQILRAETVAIVSAEFAMESIEAQRAAEDAALGRVPLPFDDDESVGDEVEGDPEDLPSMAQLKIMQDSTIKEALALIPDIADRAVLGRVRRAELETHAGGGRKIVIKAIDDRMAELGGDGPLHLVKDDAS